MCALLLSLLLLLPLTAAAQSENTPAGKDYEVFLQRGTNGGADQLIFMDMTTGESATTAVAGERYTIAGDSVIYQDTRLNRTMVANPDGTTAPHPFIQPPDGITPYRTDWVFSGDRSLVAWTITQRDGNNLSTLTFVAKAGGDGLRQVLADGPRSDGIRAQPIAFSSDNTALYMDYQPDGLSALTTFDQYASLFALNLDTLDISALPGEPGCFCGAGFGAGWMLRLVLSASGTTFDLHAIDPVGGIITTIPAPSLQGYTQAGDIVISPDGTRAVYALARFTNFGQPDQGVQTVFMLVNLVEMTQSTLTDPITTLVHPIAWTEDNSAVLFTSRETDGTWKVDVNDGHLIRVADATYLGTLHVPAASPQP